MRLACQIALERGTTIPPDSRRYLLSFVKEALKHSGTDGEQFYERWYVTNQQKPFTFSAYFPLLQRGRVSILDGDFFQFFFSTSDYEFLMRVYNGLLAIKQYTLFGKPITLRKCRLLPQQVFSQSCLVFKTLSPFLVRDEENGDFYLYPKDLPLRTRDQGKEGDHWKVWKGVSLSQFREVLQRNLCFLTKENLRITNLSAQVVPLLHGSANPTHPYLLTFPGIKGEITLEGSPQALTYLYDVGIGARRSEGFGMLEVVGE
ncbi:MAG: CRISPR-associated endoribonuclease Cas6 [Brevinematales bacterium]|nr:CRISPR-associated endoribonuclease Cas6 [Brevinematales bacterium]